MSAQSDMSRTQNADDSIAKPFDIDQTAKPDRDAINLIF